MSAEVEELKARFDKIGEQLLALGNRQHGLLGEGVTTCNLAEQMALGVEFQYVANLLEAAKLRERGGGGGAEPDSREVQEARYSAAQGSKELQKAVRELEKGSLDVSRTGRRTAEFLD